MKILNNLYFAILFILIFIFSFRMLSFAAAAHSKIDSLHTILHTAKFDTARINILAQLCNEYRVAGEMEKAKEFGKQGVMLAEQMNYPIGIAQCSNNLAIVYGVQSSPDSALVYFERALSEWQTLALSPNTTLLKKAKMGIATSLGNIGNIYIQLADYTRALDYHLKSLNIKEEFGNKQAIAVSFGNIGNIYIQISDYSKALEYQLKALKIDEEMSDKQSIASDYGNIGLIYQDLSDYRKALEYQLKTLEIYEEIGDKQGVANAQNNIGNIYKQLTDSACIAIGITPSDRYQITLEYQLKSLETYSEISDKRGIASVQSNIGVVYTRLSDYTKALEYQLKSLKIEKEIGDKYGIALSYGNIGVIYYKQKKYPIAIEYLFKAQQLANEIGDIFGEKDFLYNLYDTYKAIGNDFKALEYYERHIILRDSIFKLDNQKEILRKQMKFDYEKKATADSVKNVEEQKVKEAQIQTQQAQIKQEQTQRYALYGGLVLVILFAGFIFNRFRVTQKQKKIIEEQKKLVEVKNEEILDSIHYAKRIQQALLPTDYVLKKHLPEHFILYKPKDIVSGDFYYLTPCPSPEGEGSEALFALCDCTGHGVPGAFMSLLNISFLNDITSARKITRPDEILNRVREDVIKALNPEGGVEKGMDGMDCSLISFGFPVTGSGVNAKVQLALANSPVYVVKNSKPEENPTPQPATRNSQLIEIKPNRQPVGFSYNPKPFTLQEVELQKGDTIYMITDGFGDQFGGPKGKRYKKDKVKELLLSVSGKPMEEQKNILEKTFEEWKGNSEQTDDVTVIGIKV